MHQTRPAFVVIQLATISNDLGERLQVGRLLVIDDDPAVREVVRTQARLRGWQVREAVSAEEALASSLADCGAVLCDLRTSGLGGVGLHDHLAERVPELLDRVVFVTGDLASPETVRFAERCRRPLLHKPLDFDELFRRLGEARATS